MQVCNSGPSTWIAPLPRTDSASKVVPRSPQQAYAALMDPDALVSWLPPGGMSGLLKHFDPRPGGSYRMMLVHSDARQGLGKTTDNADVVDVRFVDLVPSQQVVEEVDFVSDDPAFSGTMTMTWEFSAVEEGTLVQVRADNVPDGISAEEHSTGMTESLQQLASYLGGTGLAFPSDHSA